MLEEKETERQDQDVWQEELRLQETALSRALAQRLQPSQWAPFPDLSEPLFPHLPSQD